MSTPVLDFIKKQIALNGPMDMGTFTGHVLAHPKYGYYIRQDPFGAEGHFITSPEISQMFGEMIGAWAADLWMKLGQPNPFILLEAGPGRGTLMMDALRATKNIPGFHDALEVHLLEASPALRKRQAKALKDYQPHWHGTLETLPRDKPLILIANEFLDALPARQFEVTEKGWMERVVVVAEEKKNPFGGMAGVMRALAPNLFSTGAEEESGLGSGLVPLPREMMTLIPKEFHEAPAESVYEFSPASHAFIRNLCAMMREQGGAALFIDYGHKEPKLGDGLRAIYRHKVVHPLTHVGDADLSFHVDFSAMAAAARAEGAHVHGPVEQRQFLKSLGIEVRAEALKKNATDMQKEDIDTAMRRLTEPDQMGNFLVIGLTYGSTETPAGF